MKQSLRTTISRICAILCALCLLLGAIPMMLAEEPAPQISEEPITEETTQSELDDTLRNCKKLTCNIT